MDEGHPSKDKFVSLEIWEKVPAEIWTLILNLIHNTEKCKETAERRRVCKIWRDVVDAHFDFSVTLNAWNLHTARNISHLRVKSLSVVVNDHVTRQNLLKSLVFRETTILKQLDVLGTIENDDFNALIRQGLNLEVLSMSYSPPFNNGRLLNHERQLQFDNVILKNFDISLPKLTKYTLVFPDCVFPSTDADCIVKFTSNLMMFLGRCAKLKDVKLTLDSGYFVCEINRKRQISKPKLSEFKLEQQLEILDLALNMELFDGWISTIKAQQKLKHFRIAYLENYQAGITSADKFQLFDDLKNTLVCNQNTLGHIVLTNLSTNVSLNMAIFQNMSKLKLLEITLFDISSDSKLLNLCKLPPSLEHLTLSLKTCFPCITGDLIEMVKRLENIREVKLVGLRSDTLMNENGVETGISQQVINGLASKQHIRKITLSHLEPERLCHVVRKNETFCLINGNFMVKFVKSCNAGYVFTHYF